MELRDYVRIFRRRWKLLAVCLLGAIAVGALITAQTTPTYTARTQLFISSTSTNVSENIQGGTFSTQRVTSYAQIATKTDLAQKVIDRLDSDLTATELASKITATASPDTVLLDLAVTDPDPAEAQILASAVASELAAEIAEIETPPGRSQPILKAQVTQSAQQPTTPSAPQPMRNIILAIALGLMGGSALAVVREVLDTTIKSSTDASDAARAPVMATIAFDPEATKVPLITSLDSHEARVEAFRVLRTNMQFVDVDARSKVFIVTSSAPTEGKSTTAVNLALTMAQAGRRVLLIDGDLRRPQVAPLLGLETVVGLTTVLVGRVKFADAIQQAAQADLSVLAAGTLPPNPAELLQSHAMSELLASVREQFDVIVIDSPPLLPVTDAALLSVQADGALLVIRYGKTTRDQVRGSTQRLESVDAKAIGVVLNMVPEKGGGYGYGYGYGYAPEVGRRVKSKEAGDSPSNS